MKKILFILMSLVLLITVFSLHSCVETDEYKEGGYVLPATFLNLEAFYRFALGDRTINPDDFWMTTYLELGEVELKVPLIKLEDILGIESINEVSISVNSYGYRYSLECGTEINVQYSPEQEGEPTFEMHSNRFTLREGNVSIIIQVPHIPQYLFTPGMYYGMTDEEINDLMEWQYNRYRAYQEQITAFFTNSLYIPITSVFMFDQAWVESAVETLDFMTEELATQLQAEISEAARANVPSPADMLMENIRANMVWPR